MQQGEARPKTKELKGCIKAREVRIETQIAGYRGGRIARLRERRRLAIDKNASVGIKYGYIRNLRGNTGENK